jgi:hypothetical protein
MNVGLGIVAAQFLFWEYIFEFSVWYLCSVPTGEELHTTINMEVLGER